MRQVLVYPGLDGYWVVECPSLPGCISQGTTREEALENIKEAIQSYSATMIEDGEQVPANQRDVVEPQTCGLPPDEFLSLLT